MSGRRVVNLIAAVGRRGQLGLGGRIPWHDPADLRWFRQLTMGGLVVVGWRTAQALPSLPGRELVVMKRGADPACILAALDGLQETRPLWIAGGAKTYELWMPHVTRFHVGVVDYDGPADTWMPRAPFWR